MINQRSCYKNEYREEYVPGTQKSPGYVESFTETIEVPCLLNSWNSSRNYKHHYSFPSHRHNHRKGLVTKTYRNNGKSCTSENRTTGGLSGGGIAAAISKKDAYGWSIPLGAVIGMGLGDSNC